MRIKCLIATLIVCSLHTWAYAATDPRDFEGVWWEESYDPLFLPTDGKPIPFTSSGLAAYRQAIEDVKHGKRTDLAATQCLPEGLPRILAAPYPFQILQRDEIIAFVFEIGHASQLIYMDQPQVAFDDVNESFMGHSVGRWDGNTLVIDTIGLKSNWLDGTGMPHGDKLHVVERLRKINAGRELENVIAIEDPDMFSELWEARRVYALRGAVQIMDYVCGEPHRDVSSVRIIKREVP